MAPVMHRRNLARGRRGSNECVFDICRVDGRHQANKANKEFAQFSLKEEKANTNESANKHTQGK